MKFEMWLTAKGAAMEIAAIQVDLAYDADNNPNSATHVVNPEQAAQIIAVLDGNKELFLYLDANPRLNVDGWFWKLRQVRNRYTKELFASFKTTPDWCSCGKGGTHPHCVEHGKPEAG